MKTGTWLQVCPPDFEYFRALFLNTLISQWRSNFKNERGTFLNITHIRDWLKCVPLQMNSVILNKLSANTFFFLCRKCRLFLAVLIFITGFNNNTLYILVYILINRWSWLYSHPYTGITSHNVIQELFEKHVKVKSAQAWPLKSNIPASMGCKAP